LTYGLKPVPFLLKPELFRPLQAMPYTSDAVVLALSAFPMAPYRFFFARGKSRSFAPLKKTAPLRMTGFVFHWRWLAPVALLAGARSFTLKHVAFKLKQVPFTLKPYPSC